MPAGQDGAAAASGASAPVPLPTARAAPQSASQPAVVSGPADSKGPQEIVVGGPPGYRVTLRMTPPSQVCDKGAFVDGVRYGYASTWNGLVTASAPQSGDDGAATRRPVFAPSSAQSMDDRYKLQWNGGTEPANACAAFGYQIGKVMGTRQAYVDARGKS
jgi:hypothetical protein